MPSRLLARFAIALLIGASIAWGLARGSLNAAPAKTHARPFGVAVDVARDRLEMHLGDPERGQATAERFQCSRCHDMPKNPYFPEERHCVRCHESVLSGTRAAPAGVLEDWQKHIVSLRNVPTLKFGGRLRPRWIARFLLRPDDVRPRMLASMPRLPLTAADAWDLAAYVTRGPGTEPLSVDDAGWKRIEGADPVNGHRLLASKGCGSCHLYTGDASLSPLGRVAIDDPELRATIAMAPDLRKVRERMRPRELLRLLADPQSVNRETGMPYVPLWDVELRDIAAYLLSVPAELPGKTPPARLPLLERRVGYDEVSAKVFRNTCWHCHSDPSYGIGDGGPGNTGGFGFKGRGLNLADYSGIAAGFVGDDGERHSVFEPADADGVPRLVRALYARHDEEADRPRDGVRGMPLGFPALSPEDIQLVESWIAQGRPQ